METLKRESYGQCPLCNRLTELTFHHLIPKSQHRKTWAKKKLSKEDKNRGLNICRLCHDGIHDLYDEKTLAKEMNTLELLRQNVALQKHSSWVAKQKC